VALVGIYAFGFAQVISSRGSNADKQLTDEAELLFIGIQKMTADGFPEQLPDESVDPPRNMRIEHIFTLQVRVNWNKNAVENTLLSPRVQNLSWWEARV